MTITFVSSYYNIYHNDDDDKSHAEEQALHLETYINYFLPFLKLRIHYVLFTSPSLAIRIRKRLENELKGAKMDLRIIEKEVLFEERGQLPPERNLSKDTHQFMILNSKKPYFVKEAINLDLWKDDSHFAWIDFGISKVVKSMASTLGFLEYLGNVPELYTGQIIIPGCWPQNEFLDIWRWNLHDYFHRVYWRFCGGFYIGDRQSHLAFYKLYETYYEEFTHSCMTWEINFWAWLEQENLFRPYWYYGDHNDTMITNFPSVCVTQVISDKCQKVENVESLLTPFCPTGFHPSSLSNIMDSQGAEWLNVRLVNYHIDENNYYHIVGGKIQTLNLLCSWPIDVATSQMMTIQNWQEPKCADPVACGIEDLRLWHDSSGNIRCMATNWDRTEDNVSQIVVGTYDLESATICDLAFPTHPTRRYEKNWAPLENTQKYVYKWTADSVYMGTIGGEMIQTPISRPNHLFFLWYFCFVSERGV